MFANLTDDDKALLFPRGHRCPVEHAVCRFARFLKHNRKLLLKAEWPIVTALTSQWLVEARKHWKAEMLDRDDINEQIRLAWDRAAYPLGIDPITDAVSLAQSDTSFPVAPFDYGETHSIIFRVVYWMNVFALKHNQPNWFASSYALAKHLNIRQTVAIRALHRMERDNILTVDFRGNTQTATRYLTKPF